jgi:hypothetical protein
MIPKSMSSTPIGDGYRFSERSCSEKEVFHDLNAVTIAAGLEAQLVAPAKGTNVGLPMWPDRPESGGCRDPDGAGNSGLR